MYCVVSSTGGSKNLSDKMLLPLNIVCPHTGTMTVIGINVVQVVRLRFYALFMQFLDFHGRLEVWIDPYPGIQLSQKTNTTSCPNGCPVSAEAVHSFFVDTQRWTVRPDFTTSPTLSEVMMHYCFVEMHAAQ